ncbi:hypothetical protein DPM35_26325 [Mesorhizobium atlanticum]|uniref:T6SS Transcription factor RovC-like DNA binding domain-containing protein n=2 Tax=Mesorhizobium atlanticum TaxID=2233532 RepID=A0A330GJG3_9HYPH|nr:hypothetical protein DPM35_26325 [Mesorhizobium atlanticum]
MAHPTQVDRHHLFEVHGEIRTRTGTIVLGTIVPIRYGEPLKTHLGSWKTRPKADSQSHMDIEMQDEVPWSDSLTAYDKEHFTTYMRFLDAAADSASYEEMAQLILGIDPKREPERARNAARSHLDRANWMVTTGYRELFAG